MFSWISIFSIAALIGLLTGFLTGRHRVYQLQNQGEAHVSQAILKSCAGPNWHLLNNITLPTTDGTTQIDHILVSRYGIFVIETKDYSGWIFGDAKSSHWTQVLYRRKSKFQNPLHQNYKHIKAVQALLDFLPQDQIEGAVLFVGDAEFKSNRPEGIFSLDEFLAALGKLRDEVISENRLQFCVGRLECQRLALTQKTDVEHQQHLQKKFGIE
jgi:restriction system protein